MAMKTQSDMSIRVVSLENLKAMCNLMSGTAHRYRVSKVTRSRVHVEYSNPDEYGREAPMVAVFPCYPSEWPQDREGQDPTDMNPRVVLDIQRVLFDAWGGEGWQAFDPLLACPTVWRDPVSKEWMTHKQVLEHLGHDKDKDAPCTSCVVCDLL